MLDSSNNSGSIHSSGKWSERITSHPLFHPFFLLLLCFLAYGILLPWLSFYADDWILLWIYQKLGAWGVNYYHITNRPFLAPLYQVLMPMLGAEPLRWHLFAVLAPWITSLSGWWLVKSLWPDRVRLAIFVSILIAVFPGYLSHAVALTTGHRNIILAIFFLSLTFSILGLRKPRYFWVFYILALITSIYNMLAMEYFLFLELSRFFVIWIILSESEIGFKEKLKKSMLLFAPFLVAFLAVLYWRVFIFPYQTLNHSLSLLNKFHENGLSGLLLLVKQTALYFWTAMVQAWTQIVTIIFSGVKWGSPSSWIYLLVILASSVITFLALRYYHLSDESNKDNNKKLGNQILLLSIIPWLLGGIPFILVGLQPGVGGYETRYLLPFLLVSCLWLSYIILVIFKIYETQILVFSVIVGLCAGLQFISSNGIRVVDAWRRNFFWNLSYRVPQLEPGTMIITNEMPTGDGTTAWTYILNWLYKPELSTKDFPYLLVMGSQLDDFIKRDPNGMGLIGAKFQADWNKVIILFSNGKSCPQVYNPEFPEEFPSLDPRAEKWLKFASLKSIQTASQEELIDPSRIFLGSEPTKGWCYFYEKADLARQVHDWQSIRELGNDAIYQQGLKFLKDTELYPFIQAYALGGEWLKALDLMKSAVDYRVRLDGVPDKALLESMWSYLDQNTPGSAGKSKFKGYIDQLIENQ